MGAREVHALFSRRSTPEDPDGFDGSYRETTAYFGEEPDPLLPRHSGELVRGRAVIDVGAGQGRHALWLAQRGFPVVAVDPSMVAARAVAAAARAEDLPISTVRGSFAALAGRERFGGVLLFGLLQLLAWDEIRLVMDASAAWLAPGGIVLITAFGTADASFSRVADEWEECGKNSFHGPAGGYRTFLEPDEALTLLPGWEVLHHWEGLGPVHRHGDGPEERHHRIELALRKP